MDTQGMDDEHGYVFTLPFSRTWGRVKRILIMIAAINAQPAWPPIPPPMCKEQIIPLADRAK